MDTTETETCIILNALISKYNLRSDYAVSQLLGLSGTAVYRYRKGHMVMDEKTAVKCTELLDWHLPEVLARLAADRAKSPEVREIWQNMATQVAKENSETA